MRLRAVRAVAAVAAGTQRLRGVRTSTIFVLFAALTARLAIALVDCRCTSTVGDCISVISGGIPPCDQRGACQSGAVFALRLGWLGKATAPASARRTKPYLRDDYLPIVAVHGQVGNRVRAEPLHLNVRGLQYAATVVQTAPNRATGRAELKCTKDQCTCISGTSRRSPPSFTIVTWCSSCTARFASALAAFCCAPAADTIAHHKNNA
eukprot:SAG11_NODE_13753_length_641_cov_0.985240_1_plen_207_part_01